jgi:N-acyl-phosphatidylethanolamine-hydrolysing phospholipase D
MQATWLGHSAVLSQWDGWNVLTDPIFSDRCSPWQLIGPKRVRPPPAQVHWDNALV